MGARSVEAQGPAVILLRRAVEVPGVDPAARVVGVLVPLLGVRATLAPDPWRERARPRVSTKVVESSTNRAFSRYDEMGRNSRVTAAARVPAVMASETTRCLRSTPLERTATSRSGITTRVKTSRTK